MTTVFHWDLLAEFALGICWSLMVAWAVYIRRHKDKLTTVASVSASIELVEPSEPAEYLTTEATDLKPMFAEVDKLLQSVPYGEPDVKEVLREVGACISCLTDFGESLGAHYEANPHHRRKEEVEEKTATHIHKPSAGSFEIRSGEVLCSVCGRPIQGLKRIAGHSLDVRHSSHQGESYVQ